VGSLLILTYLAVVALLDGRRLVERRGRPA
jgi:hypothetical protein